MLLAASGGAATILVVAALLNRPSDAPARAPTESHLTAPAGASVALDGATLRVADRIVRLEGISAPARGSACHEKTSRETARAVGDQAIDCGTAAANALATLVARATVDCAIHGHDPQGRPFADCRSGGVRLSEALVRQGWAQADAPALHPQQDIARAAQLGLWRTGS